MHCKKCSHMIILYTPPWCIITLLHIHCVIVSEYEEERSESRASIQIIVGAIGR